MLAIEIAGHFVVVVVEQTPNRTKAKMVAKMVDIVEIGLLKETIWRIDRLSFKNGY
jgi:predicted metal-dependent TIM-barrel fold hydrolase